MEIYYPPPPREKERRGSFGRIWFGKASFSPLRLWKSSARSPPHDVRRWIEIRGRATPRRSRRILIPYKWHCEHFPPSLLFSRQRTAKRERGSVLFFIFKNKCAGPHAKERGGGSREVTPREQAAVTATGGGETLS